MREHILPIVRIAAFGALGGIVLTVAFVVLSASASDRVELTKAVQFRFLVFIEHAFPKMAVGLAADRGRHEALKDVSEGALSVKVWGFSFHYDESWVNELASMDIDVDFVPGCVVSDVMLAEVAGYNEVVEAELLRRYGPGAVQIVSSRPLRSKAALASESTARAAPSESVVDLSDDATILSSLFSRIPLK